jgi:hypothetical protein
MGSNIHCLLIIPATARELTFLPGIISEGTMFELMLPINKIGTKNCFEQDVIRANEIILADLSQSQTTFVKLGHSTK